MLQRLLGSYPGIWTPTHTFADKIHKRIVSAVQCLRESLSTWPSALPLGANDRFWLAIAIEEELLPSRFLDEILFRRAENFHDTGELFLLVFAGEERIAGVQFREDTADRPHINGHAVCHPENNLRRPIEPRLD